MPVAIATIGWMGEKMTLEKLAIMVAGGFSDLTERMIGMEGRITGLEQHMDRMENELRATKDRLSRVEYGVYQIQRDFMAIDEEMRGIHRAMDSINERVIELEHRSGLGPLFSEATPS